MPRKPKRRKPFASNDNDKVWIAPRPRKAPEAAPFEPVAIGHSNRYLEFAEIALGVKETPPRKKTPSSTANQPGLNRDRKSNVTSIDSHRPLKQGTDGFRHFR